MANSEPSEAAPEGADVISPGQADQRADADALEDAERQLSEKEVAQLQARIREKGRPYEPPKNK